VGSGQYRTGAAIMGWIGVIIVIVIVLILLRAFHVI
jgi:hypothetical protein